MGITRGQKSTLAQVGSATTLATSWGTNPGVGSKILVFVQCATVPTSVVDNGSTVTTFTLDKSTTAGKGAHVYRADGITLPTAGAYSATATVSPAGTIQIIGIEYIGAVAGGPIASNNGGATSTAVTTNAAVGGAGFLYFGGFSDASGLNPETITFNSSPTFTEQARNTNGSSFWPFAMADDIDSTGGSLSISWTLGDSVAWGAVIAVYAAASMGIRRLHSSRMFGPGSKLMGPTYTKMVRTGTTIKWFPCPPFSFGSSIQQFTQDLPAVLSFLGPTNLTNTIVSKQQSVLSFTGNASKVVKTILTTATLTFTGAFVKRTGFHQTGTLSFTGNYSLRIGKALSGTLSFSGTLLRRIVSGLTAALGFTGSISKLDRASFSAALSFTGTYTLRTAHGLTGALSFTGAMSKRIVYGLGGALSFTGAMTKRGLKVLSGVLSFTGVFSVKLIFTKAFTATLGFVGTANRKTLKSLAASLNFEGIFLGARSAKVILLAATLTASASLTNIRWYVGAFKSTSVGMFRAVSRAIKNYITQKQED